MGKVIGITDKGSLNIAMDSESIEIEGTMDAFDSTRVISVVIDTVKTLINEISNDTVRCTLADKVQLLLENELETMRKERGSWCTNEIQ